MIFFFFSSRRRHTRLQGDWSSDVCSSDLVEGLRQLAIRHHSVVLLRPAHEATKATALPHPPNRDRLQRSIVGNEDPVVLSRVSEERLVVRVRREELHCAQDVPPRPPQGLHQRVMDVNISEERETPRHYFAGRRAWCSAFARS